MKEEDGKREKGKGKKEVKGEKREGKGRETDKKRGKEKRKGRNRNKIYPLLTEPTPIYYTLGKKKKN